MALTATVQSVPERTWDEVIVPSLRKRLQNESHVLSKRMSVASIGSQDDRYVPDSYQSNSVYVSREKAVVSPVSQPPRPSGIPRPSYSHSRTDTSSGGSNHRSSQSSSFQRARTVSQPQPFDSSPPTSTSPLPQPVRPSQSRSNSPMNPTKTTRIPVSRGRAGSTSSYQPSISGSMGKSDSKTTLPRYNGHVAEPSDLWPVEESHLQASVNSRSTMRTPRSQYSELVNENAPFSQNSMNSVSSRSAYDRDFAPPRQSTESEEAPFEHWYRGDVSRNGGVGELRVARKQEMLDIANYGHTFRQASSRIAITPNSRSRSNSRGRDNGHLQARPRAGSVGARESIYIDDDEHARTSAMVFDEQPLTDLDSDGEVSADEIAEEDEEPDTPRMNGTYSPSPPPIRSNTPTSTRDLSGFKSRIPTPTPKIIAEARSVTPTQAMNRAASEPSAASTSTTRKGSGSIPASQSQPNTSQRNSAKRRGKSPASTVASSKKMKMSKSSARPPPKKTIEYRRSISQYPNPEGDNMVDAIPSWTQPIPPSGNWDDVVLPVVARKKGLEGHYAQANGSPQPKPPSETIYEPAPGTFGFDNNNKSRKLRTDREPEGIPMDEFGQRKQTSPVQEQPHLRPPMGLSPLPPLTPTGSRSRPESPAPFSHYQVQEKPTEITTDMIQPPVNQSSQMHIEAEASGGCCKCIIM